MASVKVEELLLNSLRDLGEAEWKTFKWHLQKDHVCITKSDMENADRLITVDKMAACFGPEEAVKNMVKILRKMNQNLLAEQLENKHKQATFTNIVPKTRSDFLQYSHQLTLDLNTVNKYLRLFEGNRVITGIAPEIQSYPDHPDRFDSYYEQVLCREGVSGCSYWEIEWSGEYVSISVSYKSISRKGEGYECVFGYNDQSWTLFCSSSGFSFRHNKIETNLPVKPISCRVGVYVDPSAGTLSYYSVNRDTMILIHTAQTTFTDTLYPGFRVWSESSVKLG